MVRACIALCVVALSAAASRAQPDPSGIDFVTIGSPGNAPWQGDGTPDDRAIGRGGVDYEYRLGRYEVTTAQWVEFFNAAYDRPLADRLPHLIVPSFWGAAPTTPTTPGGQRWTVPAGREMLPVGNIDWRMSAMYCNWLHNDKSTDRSAFLNGAYDVSTFGYIGNIATDQATHHPGARYWIPTWDEWLKAAHYDPNRNGMGQGGWWTYSNGTDSPLVGGPPGVGQANFGFLTPSPFLVPLGAYANVTSPWGLLDMAGGTSEWTESITQFGPNQPRLRVVDGSHWNGSGGDALLDRVNAYGDDFPNVSTFHYGLRVAAPVPAPSSVAPLLLLGLLGARRSRR